MLSKSHQSALALLLLAAACVQQALGASSATPSFVISASTTQIESNPVLASQAYSKQWTISGDTNNQITAIETLALDLPGQVFITYEAAAATSTKQIGSIKVFGESEALVEAVSVASKRAMRGAKLAISSAKSPALKPAAGNSSTVFETLLTEIVLLRKSALKKVIANGWADVVIADDVLFSKRKEDYTYLNNRALRTTATAADNASSITLVNTQRQVVLPSYVSDIVDIWTVITPTSGEPANVSLNVQLEGSNIADLTRVDSDFLPEGAVGTVAVVGGKAQVTTTRSADGCDTLLITPSAMNVSVSINIAPGVKLGSVTKSNTTRGGVQITQNSFPDDTVSVFLNGSGNVFVLANNSAVFVQNATFRVAGLGFLQLEIGELRAAGMLSAGRDFLARMDIPTGWKVTGLTILGDRMCQWSPRTSTSFITKEAADAANALGMPFEKCPVVVVPKKVGGTQSRRSSDGNSSSPTSAASPRSCSVSLCGAALTLATVAFAALS